MHEISRLPPVRHITLAGGGDGAVIIERFSKWPFSAYAYREKCPPQFVSTDDFPVQDCATARHSFRYGYGTVLSSGRRSARKSRVTGTPHLASAPRQPPLIFSQFHRRKTAIVSYRHLLLIHEVQTFAVSQLPTRFMSYLPLTQLPILLIVLITRWVRLWAFIEKFPRKEVV